MGVAPGVSVDSNVLILAGTIAAGVLALVGVIWQTRARPEPLSKVVKTQQDEITRLNVRINAQQVQIDDLNSRLQTVTQLERDKSQVTAGVFLLTNQLRANGIVPVWELPGHLADKGDTGPHRTV